MINIERLQAICIAVKQGLILETYVRTKREGKTRFKFGDHIVIITYQIDIQRDLIRPFKTFSNHPHFPSTS